MNTIIGNDTLQNLRYCVFKNIQLLSWERITLQEKRNIYTISQLHK